MLLFLVAIGLILYSTFSWGFVSYVMYGWFILPIWPTLPSLTILQFIGIQMFLACLIRTSKSSKKFVSLEDSAEDIKSAFLNPWLALGIAGFIKLLFFR